MNYWKWSNGETYYQSARKQSVKETENNNNLNYDTKMNAIEQSLAEDMPSNMGFNNYNNYNDYNEYNGISDINSLNSNNNFSNIESKRESLDNKMSDRELISQRGTNPYSMQTSYVNDVVTRDMFLKPINTTQGRTKNQNNPDGEQIGN
jgi:hypothetical protein